MKKTVCRMIHGFVWVLGAVFLLFFSCAAAATVAEALTEGSARTLPSYPREELSPVLGMDWTDADYDFLYRQTGLGRSALDALKATPSRLLEFQDALYYTGTPVHLLVSFATHHDCFRDYLAPIVPLEKGDVILSSTTHTLGWRHGHAALVVDGKNGKILESVAPGVKSKVNNLDWFRKSMNFIVLRPKLSESERTAIADHALAHLKGLDYSILTGVFSAKDRGENITSTNCTHLVWQAFKDFGYDIDSDGGKVCTSHDIANSSLFEVIQVYGFDPVKYW